MFAFLLAASAAVVPAGTPAAIVPACPPKHHVACDRTPRPLAHAVPVGKRCHPDPTKSKSCREVLPDRSARAERSAREAALAAAH